MASKKFAVSPGFQEGGSIFKPEQLAMLGSIVGADAKIELTTFKQLYVEVEEASLDEILLKLPAGIIPFPHSKLSVSVVWMMDKLKCNLNSCFTGVRINI